jgi:hypothetical protein
VNSRAGQPVEFLVVTTPHKLRSADSRSLDKVITGTTRLLGAVPYRGAGLEIEVGLFSLPEQYLLGPYLDVLQEITVAVGVSYFPLLTPMLAPLRRGLDLLFGGTENAKLEIGIAHTWEVPQAGYYCVVRLPSGKQKFILDSNAHLLDRDGSQVKAPYLVFSIHASQQRDDWASIPDVARAYYIVKNEAERGDLIAAQEALATFRRVAVFSPDLLATDGVRLYELVRKEVGLAFPAVGTSQGPGPIMPELKELPLYNLATLMASLSIEPCACSITHVSEARLGGDLHGT